MACQLDLLGYTSHRISGHGARLHEARLEVWHSICVSLAAPRTCNRSVTALLDCIQLPARRTLSSMTSGEALLHELKNHEATGIPKDAGTDTPAGFDLVCTGPCTSAGRLTFCTTGCSVDR